jgi:hypothetical protein
MRELSPRELLLQNLLAQSATLLYRVSRTLHPTYNESLIIECEEWFTEAKGAIAECLEEDARAEKITPARTLPVELGWRGAPAQQRNAPIITLADEPEPKNPLKYFLG